MKLKRLVLAMSAAACALHGPAMAQEKFPSKPIRMLVPFSPGSATDFLARLVGQKMSEQWGQQIVVDNRPSAGGVVASQLLLSAAPDGHMLMMVSIGHAV
ncbi:MAG: Bug family tripartite tricarboxylate transporter substrate binding protein, partial [Rhodospirillaceae bacterium]